MASGVEELEDWGSSQILPGNQYFVNVKICFLMPSHVKIHMSEALTQMEDASNRVHHWQTSVSDHGFVKGATPFHKVASITVVNHLRTCRYYRRRLSIRSQFLLRNVYRMTESIHKT